MSARGTWLITQGADGSRDLYLFAENGDRVLLTVDADPDEDEAESAAIGVFRKVPAKPGITVWPLDRGMAVSVLDALDVRPPATGGEKA